MNTRLNSLYTLRRFYIIINNLAVKDEAVLRWINLSYTYSNNTSIHSTVVNFLRLYITWSMRYNTSSLIRYPIRNPFDINIWRIQNIYNIGGLKNLYTVLYKLMSFFYNVGRVSGSICAITTNNIVKEGITLTYYTLRSKGRRCLLQNLEIIGVNTLTTVLTNERIREQIDVIFLLDSNINEPTVHKLSKLGINIVGISSNKFFSKYMGLFIPLEISSIELNYSFLELALYMYLRGQRDKIVNNIVTTQTIVNKLLHF